jgi:hypothetical protein
LERSSQSGPRVARNAQLGVLAWPSAGIKMVATYYDPIGTAGAWTQARAMTTNSATKHVYIAAGPAGSGTHRLYRLDQGGAVLGQSSGFSNAQWLATVAGTTYLMKSRHMNRIGGTGSSVALSSFGGQIWDYSETGMAGRNY